MKFELELSEEEAKSFVSRHLHSESWSDLLFYSDRRVAGQLQSQLFQQKEDELEELALELYRTTYSPGESDAKLPFFRPGKDWLDGFLRIMTRRRGNEKKSSMPSK